LVQVDEMHERDALAADLDGMAERPQALLLPARLESRHRPVAARGRLVLLRLEVGVRRNHLAVDELPHALAQHADLVGQAVASHGALLAMWFPTLAAHVGDEPRDTGMRLGEQDEGSATPER